MHAVVSTVRVDPEQVEQARAMLNERIVPMVSAAPGFVAGYWLEPVDGQGLSIIVFESEDAARAAAPEPGPGPNPGVTMETVEIRTVVASA